MMTKKEKLVIVMNEDKIMSGTKETPKKTRLKKAKELKKMWRETREKNSEEYDTDLDS